MQLKNKSVSSIVLISAIVLLLAACAQATPEPTPTPILYDLDISVVDEDGAPVQATVDYEDESTTTAEDGTLSLSGLETSSPTLDVSAPGYFTNSVSQSLNPGANSLEVVMELDPNGLLLQNACAPGETLVYVDDFQDGDAEEWQPDQPGGWTVEPDPDNPDDLVMSATGSEGWAWLGGRDTYSFDNVVWRMWMKYDDNPDMHLNFRFAESDYDSRYIIAVNANNANFGRLQQGNHVQVMNISKPKNGEWHLWEISNFDGTVKVWVDRQEVATYDDPNPWPGGTVNIEPFPVSSANYYVNNVSICELSAPFVSIPKPVTGYDLNLTVLDAEGNPVQYATGSVEELGSDADASQMSDANGSVTWSNLTEDTATLEISGPGYFPQSVTQTIEKGTPAEVSVTLEADENSLTVPQACHPNETLLYIEDFQDGIAQGWNQLMNSIELNIPGWRISPEPEVEANTLLVAEYAGTQHTNQMRYDTQEFEDGVWRFWYKMFGDTHIIMSWHASDTPFEAAGQSFDNARYIIFTYADGGGRLEKHVQPSGADFIGVQAFGWQTGRNADNKWHLLEFLSYQGEVQVWRDGRRLGSWTDPQAIPSGYITIELDFWKDTGTMAYFDNFSVCGLSAPFETNYDTGQ